MITILLEIMRNSNSFYVDLFNVQNGYQRTLNLEMICYVVRVGYTHKSYIACRDCSYKESTFTSKQSQKASKSQGRRKFDINLKTVVVFRETGERLEGIRNRTCYLKMFSVADPSYQVINEELLSACEYVANKSMIKAAIEVSTKAFYVPLILTDAGLLYCEVSVDGSWQKGRHSSLNGAATATSDKKCLNVHVLSKHCKRYRNWEQKKDRRDCEEWEATHQCIINHDKCSEYMEAAGPVEIFQHSAQKHKLVYSQYLGDDDTSSFKEVVESNPYSESGIVPEEVEYVGHVQKRLGTSLRNKIKEYKGTTTPLSGKIKPAEKNINFVPNFYGIAIRQNSGNLYQMKEAIGAILWHCTVINDIEVRQQFFPKGESSWCKYHCR